MVSSCCFLQMWMLSSRKIVYWILWNFSLSLLGSVLYIYVRPISDSARDVRFSDIMFYAKQALQLCETTLAQGYEVSYHTARSCHF